MKINWWKRYSRNDWIGETFMSRVVLAAILIAVTGVAVLKFRKTKNKGKTYQI